jgi:hypothetical protein
MALASNFDIAFRRQAPSSRARTIFEHARR